MTGAPECGRGAEHDVVIFLQISARARTPDSHSPPGQVSAPTGVGRLRFRAAPKKHKHSLVRSPSTGAGTGPAGAPFRTPGVVFTPAKGQLSVTRVPRRSGSAAGTHGRSWCGCSSACTVADRERYRLPLRAPPTVA